MIPALILVAQVAALQTAATCRVPADPQQRIWSLESIDASWQVAFSSLSHPRVELPVGNAKPDITASRIALSFTSADRADSVEWRIVDGFSTIDLRVSGALAAVDVMNTKGALSVVCDIARPPKRYDTPPLDNDVAFQTFDRVRPLDELIVAAGLSRSVNLYQSTAGRVYAVQTIAWARELTHELKIIGIRGTFAWGVEAMPVFAQLEPSRIYGVGFAPLVWRWNFPARRSWSAFGELSLGGLWTNAPIPEDAARGNFTAHWGGGVRIRRGTIQARPGPSDAFVIGYRFQHFSNGNQLGNNPGVNSHVILAGWSHRS